MTEALRVAAIRALAELDAQGFTPDRIVLDGNHDYLRMPGKVTTVIKGDAQVPGGRGGVVRRQGDARRG